MVRPQRLEWTTELVRKFWDGVAQTRLDELSFGRLAGAQFLDLVAPYLSLESRHLDFGAGSGHIAGLMLDRGYAVGCFEPAPDRGAALEELVGDHTGFLGVVGMNSPETFDMVLLLEVIEHVLEDDLDHVLARINRFLPMGGRLIVSTPNKEDLELASVYCPVSNMLFHPWQHVRTFTPNDLAQRLADSGFERLFLGLADFSHDAAAYENFKRTRARDMLIRDYFKSHPVEAARLSDELAGKRKLIVELALRKKIDTVMAAVIWRRRQGLMAKLRYLANFRRIHTESTELISSITDMFVELEAQIDHILGFLDPNRKPMAQVADATGEFDLRHGRETTIVFVGQKVRHA